MSEWLSQQPRQDGCKLTIHVTCVVNSLVQGRPAIQCDAGSGRRAKPDC